MGKYASHHGVAAAARLFTRKLDHQVSETTLHFMKKAYLQEVTRKRANEDSEENVDLLPHQKRGRPVLLGESLDVKVQMYLRRVRDGGGVVTAWIAVYSCCSRYSPVVRPFKAGRVWWSCDIEQVLGILTAKEDEVY